MEIKNLAQLKKAFAEGHDFKILEHWRPENIGQVRHIRKLQTNGFYSIVPDEPDNRITLANNGLGSWMEYGKAANWTFENGICTFRTARNADVVIGFKVL